MSDLEQIKIQCFQGQKSFTEIDVTFEMDGGSSEFQKYERIIYSFFLGDVYGTSRLWLD